MVMNLTVKRLNSKIEGRRIVKCPSCGRKGALHLYKRSPYKPPYNAAIVHVKKLGLFGLAWEIIDDCVIEWKE